MSTEETQQATGQAPLHLGWFGEQVCLGAGPMMMRMSQAEARSLMYRLRDMLTGEDEKNCACADGTEHHDAVPPVMQNIRERYAEAQRRLPGHLRDTAPVKAAREEFTGDWESEGKQS